MHDWAGLGAQPDAVALVLREAATRLREGGWLQGRFRDPDTGAMDAVAALASVVGLDLMEVCRKERRIPAGECVLLGAALERATVHVGARALSVWNDDPERTVEQVCAALEAA